MTVILDNEHVMPVLGNAAYVKFIDCVVGLAVMSEIVETPVSPTSSDIVVGLVDMTRSCTETIRKAVCVFDPAEPVIVTLYSPAFPEHETMAAADGVAPLIWREPGLTVHVSFCGDMV